MTISRIKSPDWGIGEELTSSQINDIDENVTNALDKRAGETDTLGSAVTATGAGRITRAQVTAADADTTYDQDDGQVFRVTSTVTADRTYTLGTGATDPITGDELVWYCTSDFADKATIKNHDATTLFELGVDDAHDGQWAAFRWDGTDWKLVRHGQGTRERSVVFTASGSWVCPRGVTEVILHGVGGGGGGGGGSRNAAGTTNPSGAGGGGALLGVARVAVTPGTTYTVTIGTGGTGGAGATVDGTAGAGGQDGTDTTFADPVPTTLATFYGAGGGSGGPTAASQYARGGLPNKCGTTFTALTAAEMVGAYQGGLGVGYVTGVTGTSTYRNGGNSPVASGGACGSNYISTGSTNSMGGGGGGASGWSGCVPGPGGAGVGAAAPGTAGTAGTLGAGGGGGSGGGMTGSQNGGAGGAGGDGALRIIYVK